MVEKLISKEVVSLFGLYDNSLLMGAPPARAILPGVRPIRVATYGCREYPEYVHQSTRHQSTSHRSTSHRSTSHRSFFISFTRHQSTRHWATRHQSTREIISGKPGTVLQGTNQQGTGHWSTSHQSTSHQSTSHQSPVNQAPVSSHLIPVTSHRSLCRITRDWIPVTGQPGTSHLHQAPSIHRAPVIK